ncbi:FAD/NAD(P)-binding domain-containing protein [Periconia macrospinosa]|uniref:FAD/NAD(P)-binding domain-containing protein n=1 Tax=Periconia macrospinosa TaxID=97972 RepID=A0A2V1DB78_9PLEO|nr:FAD/NAD(P)-binding domain-containing protein [Periconia macrospinosa]
MAPATHEIVVLGANFGGVNVTHYLHRQIFPVLKKLDAELKFHVTVVSPNTHFFFKIAAPRALTKENAISNDDLFKPLTKAFDQYGESVTFIQGKAVGVNTDGKRIVEVELVSGGKQTLNYDTLFITTGTTSASPLWTLHDSHEKTIEAFKETQSRLPSSKTVLIAGAGPVGVETAGEVAFAHPNAKITLVAGGDVLEKQKLAVSIVSKAKKQLADYKVEIITNVRVKDTKAAESGTTVELSDGSSKTVDLFIDARGASTINNSFLPASWLDETGRVKADKAFKVTGDGKSDVSGIFVLGDIVAGSLNTAIELDAQVATATSHFAVDLAQKLGHKSSSGGLLSFVPGFGSSGPTIKEFKPMNALVVPIGPNGGVGQIMGFGAPSFLVKKGKAEKFLVELAEPSVNGKKYAQL